MLVWGALSAKPFNWSQWWPELKNEHDIVMTKDLEGSTFSCDWQAPIGYKLRTDIVIDEVINLKKVRLKSTGDLSGTVTCMLTIEGDSTRIDIDWQVVTNKRWMNFLSPILRPIFIMSHHAVMHRGEKGLIKYLNK